MTSKTNGSLCLVCGDKAVGFNFFGFTCESCKIFFRRHASKLEVFKCNGGNDNCKIDMYTRNNCRRCRLKKCYHIGMKKELIDYKYTKRSTSKQKEDKENSTISTSTASSLEQYTNQKIQKESTLPIDDIYLPPFELEKLLEIKKAISTAFINETKLPIVKVATFTEVLNMSGFHVRRIIKFCKGVEAFRSLPPADQLVVLKGFHCEVGCIRGAFSFHPDMDGMPVVENEDSKTAVFVGLRIFKGKTDVYRCFMHRMQATLENDSVIKDLLIAKQLFLPRDNITSQEFVRYNHQIYLHILSLYLGQKYNSSEQAKEKLEVLSEIMSELETMIDIKKQMIGDLNFNELNQEVIELFDLA